LQRLFFLSTRPKLHLSLCFEALERVLLSQKISHFLENSPPVRVTVGFGTPFFPFGTPCTALYIIRCSPLPLPPAFLIRRAFFYLPWLPSNFFLQPVFHAGLPSLSRIRKAFYSLVDRFQHVPFPGETPVSTREGDISLTPVAPLPRCPPPLSPRLSFKADMDYLSREGSRPKFAFSFSQIDFYWFFPSSLSRRDDL